MTPFSDTELFGLALLLSIVALYIYSPVEQPLVWLKDKVYGDSQPTVESGKDFADELQKSSKKAIVFYGSQTGTAEEYATRLAKEIKSRYGISSLVCDPQEYDFAALDRLPSDVLVVFVLATYGEGEPTDNAVGLVDFLKADNLELSQGGSSLPNLKYLMFCLGNSTYEHFCLTGRDADKYLKSAKATRIGARGEGDDDKSLEEDYLAWKDEIWGDVESHMGWQEGAGATIADFAIKELVSPHNDTKIYLGELSKQSLDGVRGIHDAKNPFISQIITTRELFQDGDRNCVSVEFDITNSGMSYQTGDHVGVWPLNPDREVERLLRILQLDSKRHQAINIVSMDPALAKVPTPSPTTYDSILRYYLDISQLASRQMIHSLAKYAPNQKSKLFLEKLGTDRDRYSSVVANKGLRLADILLLSTGNNLDGSNTPFTPWSIPFEHIISCIPRIQPRFYSISSSSKLHPNSIHITVVVAKSKTSEDGNMIYGLGSNYLLNLMQATNLDVKSTDQNSPVYTLSGPRNKHIRGNGYAVPIHTRISKFRLPKSVKVPLIMIGPGTGVAPFRAFIQERVFLARRAKARKGSDALKDWGSMDLFYGCRRSDWDFLYKDEWESYAKELDGKFRLHVAFSREPAKPKKYVQELLKEQATAVAEALVQKKGYLYICGDAKHMAREVEGVLESIIGKSMGGTEIEGAEELKILKERKRVMLDVWS